MNTAHRTVSVILWLSAIAIGAVALWAVSVGVRAALTTARNERIALQILRQASGPTYSLDIVDASNGNITRSDIYVILSRLERAGLIESSEVRTMVQTAHGWPRREYRITARGLVSLSITA